MGQKVNPVGLRLGIIRGWDSNWYGGKNFANKLVEDDKIRKYLNARLFKAGIAKIYIERTLKLVTVTINTARPGLIIGKGGQEVDKLTRLFLLTNVERFTVKIRLCVGSGIGPLTTAPVAFTVLTIFSADLSTKLWSKDFSLIRIF